MKKDITLDKEFVKSLLFLMHDQMECMTRCSLPPREAERLLEKLQATERLYFEAEKRELA